MPSFAPQTRFYRYLFVGLGSTLCGISINTFLVPHQMLSGGVAGVAMILHFLFSLPIGIMTVLFNIPLFYLAYRLIDREYIICALFGMLIFAAAIDATRWLAAFNFVDDTLLAAIFGGVLSGIGSGMVLKVNGSSGGTDIIAALLKKYYAVNVSYVGFGINAVLMLIAAFLFGAKPAMYTLISMYVGANVIDRVIQGINTKKTVIIISNESDRIAAAIISQIGRGVTFLQGQGAFTRQNKKVLFVVVTLVQIAKIKFLLDEIDSEAFMIVQDATEVMGRGFTLV